MYPQIGIGYEDWGQMTTVTSAAYPLEKSSTYRPILWAGLIAGTMDITAAIVTTWLRGRTAIGLLQSVASGLVGANSFKGGFKTAALGLLLHFVIAFLAATAFYVASRKLKFLVRHAVVAGLLYGVVVYFFMNRVVVPLSAAPFTISFQITGLVVHMLCVGLPISLAVRRFQSTP